MKPDRYIRQTSLKEFGPEAQRRLSKASVLVVGLGGLGIPVLQYLNAMGVGTLGLVDQDVIDLTNLQRQVLYSERDIGQQKIKIAIQKLKMQNSQTNFKAYDRFLVRDNALGIIENYDLVIDASDNFATRYLINDACVILKKPFVYGALHGFEGQVSVFNYKGGPTYRCLFPDMPSAVELPDCNENGVLGIIPGIIGNLQALEAVKILAEVGEVLSGKLLIFNGLDQTYQKINFPLKQANLHIEKLQESYDEESCAPLPSISASRLNKLIENEMQLQLIDVRSEEEFADHSLARTRNIPLDELENRISEINLELPVYFLCQSGKRSEKAVIKIQDHFQNTRVYNVEGGINQYALVFY